MPRKNNLDKFYNEIFSLLEIHPNNNALLRSQNDKTILVHKDRLKNLY